MPLRVARLARPKFSELTVLDELLGRELSGHLRQSFAPVEYSSTRDLLRGAASRDWDVAWLPLGGEHPPTLAFTSPYLEVECAYLVPATGPIRCIEDADRPGIRIAMARDSPAAGRLVALLRHAHLRRVASETVAMRHLHGGDAEVVAGFRIDLVRLADQNDGYWVLMDPVFALSYALAVPYGDADRFDEVTAFVGQISDSGLISEHINRNRWPGVYTPPIRNAMSAEGVTSRRGGS